MGATFFYCEDECSQKFCQKSLDLKFIHISAQGEELPAPSFGGDSNYIITSNIRKSFSSHVASQCVSTCVTSDHFGFSRPSLCFKVSTRPSAGLPTAHSELDVHEVRLLVLDLDGRVCSLREIPIFNLLCSVYRADCRAVKAPTGYKITHSQMVNV